MLATIHRQAPLAALLAIALNGGTAAEVRAQMSTGAFQGAWIEQGEACESAFALKGGAIVFRRPASVFAPAFIVAGRRLSTPLASCRIVSVSPKGERQILNLSCTTSISVGAAHAIVAPAEGGMLTRYFSAEGGGGTKYQRCGPDALKPP
jgi:hypothetical protein